MQRSLFLSSTSLALALHATGCSDDACGPPSGTHSAGLLASSADVVINYGNLRAGINNDCGTTPEVISLTLQGSQAGGEGGLLTLCVPRPDLLQKGTQRLGSEVFIIDFNAVVDGCMYNIERGRPVTGDVTTTGMCGNGGDEAGFAMTIDAALSLTRMCPTANDIIAVTFAGTVAVAKE